MDTSIVLQQPFDVPISDSDAVFIYGLVCPRSGIVMYVGKSNNLGLRMAAHVSDARLGGHGARCDWIRQLEIDNLAPSIIEIEKCSDAEWPERERHWIAYYRSVNPDLTNVADGGGWTGKRLQTEPVARKKVFISLHSDALSALSVLATERKRGDFVSELIMDAFRRHSQSVSATSGLRDHAADIAVSLQSLLEKIDRMSRVES